MAFALRLAGATAGMGGQAVGGMVTNAATSCFRNFTNGIPHPTECSCIGAICYYLGLHDHQKFNLLIDLHELERLPDSSSASFFVEIHCGRWTVTSQVIQGKKSPQKRTVTVEERLLIHVRQVDSSVSFLLYKKGLLKSELIAQLQLKVKEDLFDKQFPKRQWYSMEAKKGTTEPRLQMSLYKLDASLPTGQSPLLQQALLIAQQDADEKGEKLKLDLGSMSQKERLVFFSRVLEGPLEKMSDAGGNWILLYFKCVEVKTDRWEWCYWVDKVACYQNAEKKGSIPFLAISVVLPDQKDRNVFYVRYHDKKNGQNDVFLRRVDRDRNLWSDGLYEFIERLRAYREVCVSRPDGDTKEKKKKEKEEREGEKKKSKKAKSGESSKGRSSRSEGGDESSRMKSPRGSPASTPRRDISCTRRLNSPRGSLIFGDGNNKHTPNARQQMLEEVMLATTSTTTHSSNEEEETL